MKHFTVTGMSCAACSARVERAVTALPAVEECTVNLLTGSLSVSGEVTDSEIIAAVKAAGYGIKPKKEDSSEGPLTDLDSPRLLKRFLLSIAFLLPLTYISMGYMAWGFPLPAFLTDTPVLYAGIQLVLSLAVIFINRSFFINGAKALISRSPNMDTLVSLGSFTAFVYSLVHFILLFFAMGNAEAEMHYLSQLYFESAAMFLTFITVGKYLEARSKGKTADALRGLMRMSPKTVTVLRDGVEHTVPIESISVGDLFVLRPGERIPVDGTVESGESTIDESILTGESLPNDKTVGSPVYSGTYNRSGRLICRATRVGKDTTLSQIIRIVEEASSSKAPIAKLADRVSGVFVPIVIALSLLTALVWLLIGESVGFALARAISVLVISCPCALGLATPVAIMVGSGHGAKHGILFKNGTALEVAGRVKIAVLDKTGTITEGAPRVTDILPYGIEEEALLSLAAALENGSEHPLANAIVSEANARTLPFPEAEHFEALTGHGVRAEIGGDVLLGGSYSFISQTTTIPDTFQEEINNLSFKGKTPLLFTKNGIFIGMIAVSDTVRSDSRAAIEALKRMGITVIMLTGDNRHTAETIGKEVGVDEVIAEVLPSGKETVVRSLMERGRVAMVGDGINDAPALCRADLGIAIGCGADVAVDSADVVLTRSALSDVPATLLLGRKTLASIRMNLFWAFFYNAVCIPIAMGALVPLGFTLEPTLGALAMSLSSFTVVMNALRLNLAKLHPVSKQK